MPTTFRPLALVLIAMLYAAPVPAQRSTSAASVSRQAADSALEAIGRQYRRAPDSSVQAIATMVAKARQRGDRYTMGRALSLQAWLMAFDARYEEALAACRQAAAIQDTIRDAYGHALTLNRMGFAYQQFDRLADAKRCYDESLRHFTSIGDSARMDMVINNIGALMTATGDYRQALPWYRQSMAIRQARGDHFWTAYSHFNIAAAFLNAGMVDSASRAMTEARRVFTQKTASGTIPAMVEAGYAELLVRQGRYREAHRAVKTALATAHKQRHTEIVIQATALHADILKHLGHHAEAYAALEEHLALRTTADSANSAIRVAAIEQRYHIQERETELANLRNERLRVENEARTRQLSAMAVGAAFLILAVLLAFVLVRRNHRQRVERAALTARIADMRVMALRAQMTPHFIFNCINTAQHFVMNGQPAQAYDYLSRFARLLRLVLEKSGRTFVPIDDEVDQLRLYLELEAIRFDGAFHYTVEVDPTLSSGSYDIPGMVLQPIVENAIVHGIANRGDTLGSVSVRMERGQDVVICTVTDNGVGRERATAIKAAKDRRYPSAATPNIDERLEILRTETGLPVTMQVVDQVEDGMASGTTVVVTLPYR